MKADSTEFITNYERYISAEKKLWSTWSDESLLKRPSVNAPEFQSTTLNVVHGLRRTVCSCDSTPPPSRIFRVRVFGGSTVFCGENADEDTLPSRIQDEINRRCRRPPELRVENWGRRGATFWNRVLWASTLDTDKRDVNIFLVGVNDCGVAFLRENVQGSRLVVEMIQALDRLVGTRFHLVGLVSRPALPVLLRRPLQRARSAYADAFDTLRSLSERNRTIIILQPSLFWHPNRWSSKRHRARVGNSLEYLPARWLEYQNYDWIADMSRSDARIGFRDMRRCLDHESPDIYLDRCHLRAAGNGSLARQIVGQLEQILLGT